MAVFSAPGERGRDSAAIVVRGECIGEDDDSRPPPPRLLLPLLLLHANQKEEKKKKKRSKRVMRVWAITTWLGNRCVQTRTVSD